MTRIVVFFGTRPEVIKLAPVVHELRKRPQFDVDVCWTGQHRQMAQQAMDVFDIRPDAQFDAMLEGQTLGRLTASLFRDVDALLEGKAPDWVLVQGDTTSAMVGALGAFYRRIKVGHVEAGLRTFNRLNPFPEEVNRTIVGQVATLHFAPTQRAVGNLLQSGVARECIHLTGNTVVDAVNWVAKRLSQSVPVELGPEMPRILEGRRLMLVTSHRRETFGQGLDSICEAILRIVQQYRDIVVVYPVHLNPVVKRQVHARLSGHERVHLLEPLSYVPLLWLMRQSHLILTDSGGIQEEAPSLGKPVLVIRDVTERPEGIEAGSARMVGTKVEGIVAGVRQLIDDPNAYRAMAQVRNPFGDGRAAERIVQAMVDFE